MDARPLAAVTLSVILLLSTGGYALLHGPSAPQTPTQPSHTTIDANTTPNSTEHSHPANNLSRDWATTFGPENPPQTDPDTDQLGWENGYWHNEQLNITTNDGLTERELEKVTARSKARVEHLRGIEFEDNTDVSVISRNTYQSQYGHNTTYTDTFRTFDNAKFEAMFLVGEDQDSLAVQDATRGSSVGGFYDRRTNDIVIVSDSTTLEIEESTLIHELVHAAQDQQYDLSQYNATSRNGYGAETGLIEGDANFVEQQYDSRCERDWNCVTPIDTTQSPPGSEFNWGIYLLEFFPYSDGPGFIAHLGSNGGWDAINNAFSNPPTSSSEIIHPDSYPATTRNPATPTDTSNTDWSRLAVSDRPNHASLGEAALFTMFANTVYDTTRDGTVLTQSLYEPGHGPDPYNYDYPATNQYVDDKLYVYQNAAGDTGYTWTITFETRAGASAFTSEYKTLLDYYRAQPVFEGSSYYVIDTGTYEDAFTIRQNGTTVTIVNAPSVEALTEIDAQSDMGGTTTSLEPPTG